MLNATSASKTGRNDPCPCGSGLKYKKCCLSLLAKSTDQKVEQAPRQVFIANEVAKLQSLAAARKASFRLIGALAFFSTTAGDAWVVELSEQDALRVAKSGTTPNVNINETEETLEIGWTHRFELKKDAFVTTAYADESISSHGNCPTASIREAMTKIKRQYTREELDSIRL